MSPLLTRSPLLPASATGTVDTHSIVDPIRSHLDARSNYFEAECTEIDAGAKTVTCAYTRPFRDAAAGAKDHVFKLDYDILVIAVLLTAHQLHPEPNPPCRTPASAGPSSYESTPARSMLWL